MYCSRLHAWWSTQLRLATLLSSLIAGRWVGLQTLDGSDLKTYLLMLLWLLSGPPGLTYKISFALVFSFVYSLALSLLYLLLYLDLYVLGDDALIS